VFVGGLLCGLGWVLNAFAIRSPPFTSLPHQRIGAGAVYGTCVGNALKWFKDRRGLAAGLTAAGFGAGSALTILPITAIIKSSGYEAAFLYFGIGQGLIVLVMSLFLTDRGTVKAPRFERRRPRVDPRSANARDYPPMEFAQPVFWVMYVMFVMVAAGGLMATAQIGAIAKTSRSWISVS